MPCMGHAGTIIVVRLEIMPAHPRVVAAAATYFASPNTLRTTTQPTQHHFKVPFLKITCLIKRNHYQVYI